MSNIIHARPTPYTRGRAPVDLVKLGAGAATVSGDTGFACTDVDVQGGALLITTDSTDNDCGTVNWGSAINPAVNGVFGFRAVMKHTEGSTNAANWFIGFSDVVGSTFFGDTGALATMDAFGIYKVESSMFFRTCSLNATTQGGSTTTTAFASATTYVLELVGRTGTAGIDVTFKVDGTTIGTLTGVTVTGVTEMFPVIAVANGAGAAEPLTLYSFIPYGS